MLLFKVVRSAFEGVLVDNSVVCEFSSPVEVMTIIDSLSYSYCVTKLSYWRGPMLLHGATKEHYLLASSRFGDIGLLPVFILI